MRWVSIKKICREHPWLERTARRMMAAIPSTIRLGGNFWYWYAFLEESEAWSEERLREYQMQRLRELLYELSEWSPYYNRLLYEVDIEGLDTIEKFQNSVPALTRQQFAANQADMLSCYWRRKKLTECRTSGTTGLALQFYHDIYDQAREDAAICHQWKRVGFRPGVSRRAEFRGMTSSGQPVALFPDLDMIRCSIIGMDRDHVRYYADAIRKHDIGFYHGYPSALTLLSAQILRYGIDFPQPQAILLASEAVHLWQLEQMQEAFPQAKLFAHYGCAERTVLAGWCEHRREYHVLPQYSLVEIDPATSEVIGTNLFNSVNGFVRYRMTDTVIEIDYNGCPSCGRPYVPRLVTLGGRKEDYLFSPEHGWIPPAVVTFPLKGLAAIGELQFHQRERDEITIRYSVRRQVAEEPLARDIRKIESGLVRLLGNGMRLRWERVADFERDSSGKYKWIICEIHKDGPFLTVSRKSDEREMTSLPALPR